MFRMRRLMAAISVIAACATHAHADKGNKVAPDSARVLRDLTTVQHLLYTPDGKSVLVEYRNPPDSQGASAVGVWDVETGKHRSDMEKPPQHCEQIAVSPDGARAAAVAAGDRRLTVWDVADGKLVQEFELPAWEKFTPAAPFLAFSADGKVLTSVAKQKIVRAKLGGDIQVLPEELDRWAPELIAYSLATDVLVIASNPAPGKKNASKLQVYDLSKTGAPQAVPLTAWVRSIALAPDGKTLAVSYERQIRGSTSIPGKVELWDAVSWKPTDALPPDKRKDFLSYRRLVFSPDGKELAAWPTFGVQSAIAVEFVDLKGNISRAVEGSDPYPNQAAFSPDGKTAAVVLGKNPILFLDPTTGKDKGP